MCERTEACRGRCRALRRSRSSSQAVHSGAACHGSCHPATKGRDHDGADPPAADGRDSPHAGGRRTARATAGPQAASQPTAAQIYAQCSESVVEIEVTPTVTSPFGDSRSAQAEGAGFVYDEQGHIVTNQHVVDGGTPPTRVVFSQKSE